MAYNKGDKDNASSRRRPVRRRKKVCVFCGEKNGEIDYKATLLFLCCQNSEDAIKLCLTGREVQFEFRR